MVDFFIASSVSSSSFMTSKTLQFDKALDEYFVRLEVDKKGGQWRICRFSGEKFYVRPEDIEFYKKIRVPLPTISPSERSRRRMAYSPGYAFFKVKSALDGKPLISVLPPTTPFQIYPHSYWLSHKWDPVDFGIAPDDQKPFFAQFKGLQLAVPRPNLNSHPANLNSDYTNNSSYLKNCYMTVDAVRGEDLYYFNCCQNNKNCVDCWSVGWSDTCYQCWGDRLWKCFFCQYTYDTTESYFLFDCRNCSNCFMSANLRNKKYYFFNEPLTKEEYERRTAEINLGDYAVFQQHLKKYEDMKTSAIHKENFNDPNNIDSIGDWMWNSKNCFQVIYSDTNEYCAYSLGFYGYRDSYDVIGGMGGELCYELMTISTENNYGVKFSTFINNSRDLEYCDLMRNCHDCFGCIGLSDKSFCVFNKQYTEDEYWRIVDELKVSMLARGEYGEFFPPNLSYYPYNYSLVNSYPGYGDLEEAKRLGYVMEFVPEDAQDTLNLEVILASKLPQDIKDADDSILEKVIFDEKHNKKFRITKFELVFYRKYGLPLPRVHPLVRMQEWRKSLDLRLNFYPRKCAKCGKEITSTYALDRPENNIYCEACYRSEVL